MDRDLSEFQAEIEGRMQVQTRAERAMKINANWIMPVHITMQKEEEEEQKKKCNESEIFSTLSCVCIIK